LARLSTNGGAVDFELAVLDPAEARLATDAVLAAEPEAARELHVSPCGAEIGDLQNRHDVARREKFVESRPGAKR
jgi:hypothetical protein